MQSLGDACACAAIAIAIAGCWRDATTITTEELPPASMGACPGVVESYDPDSWLWARELFAGCAPAPFFDEVVCRGGCPAPCREHVSGPTRQTIAFTYDHGHLLDAADTTADRSTANYMSPFGSPTHCTYDHGALASCTTARGPLNVHRDTTGRIVRLDRDNGSIEVTYDARGDAVEIVVHGDRWFTHNDSTTFAVQLRFDALHRVIEERGAEETITHEYDRHGHLIDRGARHRSFDPATGLLRRVEDGLSSTTFSYDAAGRPTRITHRTLLRATETPPRPIADDVFVRSYDYACPQM